MPPPLLFDFHSIDLEQIQIPKERIYSELLPHRHEFMVLDGIVHADRESLECVGFCDVRSDAWWVKGHVPDRPLMPGVLMLEMAGQTTAILASLTRTIDGFIVFGGVDTCKFRDSVSPPARLYILSKVTELRSRRVVADTQGVCDGRLIFQATVTGMAMR